MYAENAQKLRKIPPEFQHKIQKENKEARQFQWNFLKNKVEFQLKSRIRKTLALPWRINGVWKRGGHLEARPRTMIDAAPSPRVGKKGKFFVFLKTCSIFLCIIINFKRVR